MVRGLQQSHYQLDSRAAELMDLPFRRRYISNHSGAVFDPAQTSSDWMLSGGSGYRGTLSIEQADWLARRHISQKSYEDKALRRSPPRVRKNASHKRSHTSLAVSVKLHSFTL